jgi:glucose/arabinose dehydrogenase
MRVSVLWVLSILVSCSAYAAEPGDILFEEKSHQADFRVRVIADRLSSPWGLDFLPDGRLLVTEWAGALRIVADGEISAPLGGVPAVLKNGDKGAGLLDIALHLRFADNQTLYLCHLHGNFDSNVSRIVRARLVGDELRDVDVIFEGNDRAKEFHHSGCRFAWDDEGYLYATFGDRRHLPEQAQELNSTTGTVIRIEEDGDVPGDNPFRDVPRARPEIWAYGVRNVQGAAFHPVSRDIWFAEHGPLGGDEINILKRGANYGWPIATFGIDYDGTPVSEHQTLEDVQTPLVYWRPSTAPSGLAFYTGEDFPDWKGDLFMGSLVDRRLIRMELDGSRVLFQEYLLEALGKRIREVIMGPDGFLYILTDADPGEILRLEPGSAPP